MLNFKKYFPEVGHGAAAPLVDATGAKRPALNPTQTVQVELRDHRYKHKTIRGSNAPCLTPFKARKQSKSRRAHSHIRCRSLDLEQKVKENIEAFEMQSIPEFNQNSIHIHKYYISKRSKLLTKSSA